MRGRYDRRPIKYRHEHFINEHIRAKQVRLIAKDGENVGIVSCKEALERAQDVQLDLVQIGKAGEDEAPVVKIMDYGKFLYERKKKQHEAKKHQKVVQIKEVKLRPNIGDQDYDIKLKRAIKFLSEGKKVKFTLQFRGREKIMMRELGNKFFVRLTEDLQESSVGSLNFERETRSGNFWSKIVEVKTK